MRKTVKPTKRTGALTTKGECEMRQNSGLAHCMYGNSHWDYCSNYQERIEYLLEVESSYELHLKLFKLVPNELLPGIESAEWKAFKMAVNSQTKAGRSFAKAIETYIMAMKAFDKIGKAREAYEKAWEALEKANIAYYKARDAYYSKYANELQILHDEMFPDCTWDGKTIF
jgi:hypothetical protein